MRGRASLTEVLATLHMHGKELRVTADGLAEVEDIPGREAAPRPRCGLGDEAREIIPFGHFGNPRQSQDGDAPAPRGCQPVHHTQALEQGARPGCSGKRQKGDQVLGLIDVHGQAGYAEHPPGEPSRLGLTLMLAEAVETEP